MKKLVLALFGCILLVQMVLAVSVGTGVTPNIGTEDFAPRVWMCDGRVVYDDNTEPGRLEGGYESFDHWEEESEKLLERINNYAFEGEQIKFKVLVMDKNGVEKIKDVFGAVGNSGGDCDDIQVNCQEIDNYKHCDGEYCRNGDGGYIPHSCNARIDEEYIRHFNDDEMQFYECTITVETPESMYGEYWLTVQAEDMDGLKGIMDEKEYWFLNPVIALSLEGYMDFENVRPGTDSYASTMLVGNDADAGSGVLLDMFITGTDFYDSSASGAMCPTTNKLGLSAFRYFATNGAYSTSFDSEVDDVDGDRDKDAEGYVNVEYGKGWNDPKPFYNNAEILQAGPMIGPYWAANILAPGSEMAITFKLSLPEPCNGDFDTGSIYFWGEAI